MSSNPHNYTLNQQLLYRQGLQRRVPREPEADHTAVFDQGQANSSSRPRLDPPTVDPPESSDKVPNEEEEESRDHREQEKSVADRGEDLAKSILASSGIPFVTRSNQHSHHIRRRDPSVVDYRVAGSQKTKRDPSEAGTTNRQGRFGSTPTRTPNPVSRSNPASPTFLKQILMKSSRSFSSNASSAGSFSTKDSDALGKKRIKNVLAKRMMKKNKGVITRASYDSTMQESADQDSKNDDVNLRVGNQVLGVSTPEMGGRRRSDKMKQIQVGSVIKDRLRRVRSSSGRDDSGKQKQTFSQKPSTEAPSGGESKEAEPSVSRHQNNNHNGNLANAVSRIGVFGASTGALTKPAADNSPTFVDVDTTYASFFQVLQSEVSGQHTMLWSSFQRVMGGKPPLNDFQLPSTQAQSFKFNASTKKILTDLHSHLKQREDVQWSPKPQLVNDKKFSKELRTDRAPDPILQVRSSASSEMESANNDLSRGSAAYESGKTSSLDRRNDAILEARSSSSLEEREKQQHRMMPSLTDSVMTASADDEDLSRDDGDVSDTGATDVLHENSSNPGLEVTWGQFRSKTNLRTSAGSPTISDNGTISIVSEATSSVPWANVKLRSVPKDKPSSPPPIPGPYKQSDLSDGVATIGKAVTSDSTVLMGSSSKEEDDDDMHSKVTLDTELKSRPEPTSSPDSLVSHPVHAVHESIGQKIANDATIISLKNIPGCKMGSNETARVVVAKQILMVVKSVAGDPRATVVFRYPRSAIDSLLMDMTTLQVKLIFVHGGDENVWNRLSFLSAEDVLTFTNAFYSECTPKLAEKAPEGSKDVPINVVDETMSNEALQNLHNKDLDDLLKVESLNEEEQTVLETYRRLRRTKGKQDALDQSISFDASLSSKAPSYPDQKATLPESKVDGNALVSTKKKGKVLTDTVDGKVVISVLSEDLESTTPPDYVKGDPISPVSAISSLEVSVAESELVHMYKEMLRQDVKPETVRDKMEQDHVDPKLVPLVLGGNLSLTSAREINDKTVLTEEEESVASSFRKMLKMKFPEEVVRHRMVKEEVSEKIVLAVLGSQETAKSESLRSGVLSLEEEEIAQKYRKRFKLGLPVEAVRHGMLKDQVSRKIIDAVIGDVENPVESKPVKPCINIPRKKDADSKLSVEEESVASNYRKMLKLQIPKERVLSRMQQDGVSDKIMTSVVGKQIVPSNTAGQVSSSSAPGSKLVSLHWTPLSGKELDNSVWRVNNKLEDSDSQPEGGDISKLITLFQKKTSDSKGPKNPGTDGTKTKGKAKLLDLTRSNNVAISLKAFKEFSHDDLANILGFLDPQQKISGERVLFLRGLLPAPNEIRVIKDYTGSDDRLVPAEIWFRKIIGVKRLDEKVHVIQTMETYQAEATSLRESFLLLSNVCNQVMDSEKLQVLLGMVLRIGNIMNEGTRTGRAAGFKFDSLLRLTQTKSSDGKLTVLDFLVTVFVEKGQRETLCLSADFPDCQNASRMVLGDLLGSAKSLEDALDRCERELELLEKEVFKTEERVEPSHGATPSENDEVEKKRFSSREKFLAAVKEKQQDNKSKSAHRESLSALCTVGGRIKEFEGSLSEARRTIPFNNDVELEKVPDSVFPDTLEGGIERLREFLSFAGSTKQNLCEARKTALDSCRELSRYCGESGGTGATTTLLGILAQFAANLDSALLKYDAAQEASIRRQRKDGNNPVTGNNDPERNANAPKGDETNGNGESLVVLVSNMLKQANDRTKEDFKKGRRYDNPSNTLKAIYAKEQHLNREKASNPPRRERDIVSAIRKQEKSINPSEVLKARSQFGEMPSVDQRNAQSPRSAKSVIDLTNADEATSSSSTAQNPVIPPKKVEYEQAPAPNTEELDIIPGNTLSLRPTDLVDNSDVSDSCGRVHANMGEKQRSSNSTDLTPVEDVTMKSFQERMALFEKKVSQENRTSTEVLDSKAYVDYNDGKSLLLKETISADGREIVTPPEDFELSNDVQVVAHDDDFVPSTKKQTMSQTYGESVGQDQDFMPSKEKQVDAPKADKEPSFNEMNAAEGAAGKITEEKNCRTENTDPTKTVCTSPEATILRGKVATNESNDTVISVDEESETANNELDPSMKVEETTVLPLIDSPVETSKEPTNLNAAKEVSTASELSADPVNVSQQTSVDCTPTKQPILKPSLSSARKTREKLQGLVNGSPPPVIKESTVLAVNTPTRKKSNFSHDSQASITLDVSGSERRLSSKSPLTSSAKKASSSISSGDTVKSEVTVSTTARTPPRMSTPSREKSSLLDLARQRRSQDLNKDGEMSSQSSSFQVDADSSLPGKGKESPMLRMARERRERKND